MILPLGDEPNPRGIPFVTYALLALNVGAYLLIALPLSGVAPDPSDPALAEYLSLVARALPRPVGLEEILAHTSAYDLFVFHHGFRPIAPSVADLFFSLFLHAGFAHLAGNMLFLWIYGDNVEHRLGALRYAAAYLATGVAATLFHTVFAPNSPLPLVGASGAISGVLGFYFLWFPRNQVRLLFFFFPFMVDVITVPARLLLGFYVIADNLLPFLLARGDGGVAHGAHIGGFFAGLAIAWWMDRRLVSARPSEFLPGTGRRPPAAAPAADLREMLAAGRFAEAAAAYFALPPEATRALLAPAELLALADWLHRNGHDRAALTVYLRVLRDSPHEAGAAEAHYGAGVLQLESFGQATAAYQHFLDALDLDPSPELAARIRTALAELTARQKQPSGRPALH